MKMIFAALPLAAGLVAAPALAELPESTKAMIEAAIASGDPAKVATVIELAREVHPEDGDELTAIQADFDATQQAMAEQRAAEREQQIRQAGLFENWTGEGQVGAFRTTGNTSSTGISAGLRLARKGINWRHKLRALVDFQRTEGITTREQFLASYEPNIDITDKLYAYGFGQYERDVVQGYTARYAVSGGIGYRMIETDTMRLEVKGGPAWRRTDLVTGTSIESLSALVAADFDWAIAQNISLTQDVSAFIEADNTSISSTTGLDLGINDALSARISYSVEYDADPPFGAVGTDTISRFTLVYGF